MLFISLGQLILFVEWLKVEVNLANIITSVFTIFICYLLNVKFVFKGGRYSKKKRDPCVLYFLLYGISFKCGTHVRVDRIPVNLVCGCKNISNHGRSCVQFNNKEKICIS